MMLSFQAPALYQTPKCFVTHGVMAHLDPNQPPSKGKPWAPFLDQDFISRADLIIPQDVFELVKAKLLQDEATPKYTRVIMSLHDILSGEFLTRYVKDGNLSMLSEGRLGIDNVFALRKGVLTMYLDKETYERAGLVGKPHGVKGKRGLKPRWVVEIDLTASSMVPGKKGFNRIVYASKNALNESLTWLLCNNSSTVPVDDILKQHSPTNSAANVKVDQVISANVPELNPPASTDPSAREDFEYFTTELYEWLSLVRLGSPRVTAKDQIDPYLSRYQVPEGGHPARICKISWQGFSSPSWSHQRLMDLIAVLPSKTWFSFSTSTFSKGLTGDNSECTVLRVPDSRGEFLLWEVKSHE
ncbi:ribonuclease P 40kDa subunit-domain-containing protein [Cladorrhinum sp. PSN259]|nr:ribonuclease P 40kDa subunit-domain-containing protein [Cladorrhinum sp. PSN259]